MGTYRPRWIISASTASRSLRTVHARQPEDTRPAGALDRSKLRLRQRLSALRAPAPLRKGIVGPGDVRPAAALAHGEERSEERADFHPASRRCPSLTGRGAEPKGYLGYEKRKRSALRHQELHHQTFLAVGVGNVLAMDEAATSVFEPGHGARTRSAGGLRVERFAVENDFLAVERWLAPPKRHPCRTRVGPHAREDPRLRLESNEAQADRLARRSVERELGLEEPAFVNHRLLTGAGRARRLTGPGVERLDDVPVARKSLQELLAGARGRARLVRRLGIGRFLRGQRQGEEEREDQEKKRAPCELHSRSLLHAARRIFAGAPPDLHRRFARGGHTPKCHV